MAGVGSDPSYRHSGGGADSGLSLGGLWGGLASVAASAHEELKKREVRGAL